MRCEEHNSEAKYVHQLASDAAEQKTTSLFYWIELRHYYTRYFDTLTPIFKPLSHWMQVNLQDKLQVFLIVTFLFTKCVCVTFTTQQKILIYDVSTMHVTAIMQLAKTLWKRQFCHYVYWHARLALSVTHLYVNLCIFVFCQKIFLLVTG